MRLDNLNTTTQNETLSKKLDDLVNELGDKEKDVQQQEKTIKGRLLQIQKKTLEVDRLNRICAKLKGQGDGDEFIGPVENHRDNIKKQIKEIDD